MRISRRTSGGRGEYELTGVTEDGTRSASLTDQRIRLLLGDLSFDSGAVLTNQGGKRRFRITINGVMQVPRQIAAALMLPLPVRADLALGAGLPVIQGQRYAIEHANVKAVEFGADGCATLSVDELILRNAMVEAEELNIRDRVKLLSEIYARVNEFPNPISSLLQQHGAVLMTGKPVTPALEGLVATISAELSENAADLGINYSQQLDPLPALRDCLLIVRSEPAFLVEDVDADEIEVRRRTLKEWKRWANDRGPKSAVFRQEVRRAYNSTCVVCGLKLPRTSTCSAGVDAAHILPWSQYDLDLVSNGLCLCKVHHWAFDEGLIRVVPLADGGFEVVVANELAASVLLEDEKFSIESLRTVQGRIPEGRLPRNRTDWPRRQFLEALNAAQT